MAVLAAYNAVRPAHCRRVLSASRAWGRLWHLDGTARTQRNALLRARSTYDYSFIDWLYATTALPPDAEPEMFTPVPLAPADAAASATGKCQHAPAPAPGAVTREAAP